METTMMRSIKSHLAELKLIRERSYNRYMELNIYASWFLKPGTIYNGTTYYNVKKPDSKKLAYLGNVY